MNGNVRRMFNLDEFVEIVDGTDEGDDSYESKSYVEERIRLLPKKKLMKKLEEFDNLINAMGALFYASKRM